MSGHLIGCVKHLKAKTYEVTNADGTTREVRIGKSHKLAMVAFADSADDQTHIGFAGYKGVQEWAACSRSRAAELVTDLVDTGLLRLHRSARPGKNAEYVVFPGGCCDAHRAPAADGRDTDQASIQQLLASLEEAGMPLTDEQRRLLAGGTENGSEFSDSSRGDESGNPDPSAEETRNGSEISDPSAQRVQNESEISEYSTTPTTPPSPRERGATAAADDTRTCQRHGTTPAPNCRGCGTTNRQVQKARNARAAEQRRAAAEARFAAEGGALRPNPAAVPLPPDLKAQARKQIRANRDRKAAS